MYETNDVLKGLDVLEGLRLVITIVAKTVRFLAFFNWTTGLFKLL